MIVFETVYPTGTIVKSGGETFEVAAGKNLKLETSPEGVTYLNDTVPVGKKWIANISVSVKEVDA